MTQTLPDSAATGAASPVVELRGVRHGFEGVQALRGVSFEVGAGEVVGLIGENGAGKSTLVKILTGVLQPDEGSLLLHGEPVRFASPRAARHAGIAAMYQEPLIFPDLSVAENIFVGRQPSRSVFVDWSAMQEQAHGFLRRLGIELDPKTPARDLSVAERQLVEIAKALSLGAQIVILDEPTAVLSAREVDRLLEIVRRLREHGITLLYITHRLDEVMQVTDRVVVLRDGEKVADVRTAETTMRDLVRSMVGQELAALEQKRRDAQPSEEVMLDARGLTRYGYFEDVSFQVRRGEILGVFGLVGAGRTEVAQALFGIDPIDAGSIVLDGRPFAPRSPRHAIRSGVAYLPENRLLNGLVAPLAIRLNMTMTIWSALARLGIVRERPIDRSVDDLARRVRLQRGSRRRPASTLSGGNQQKVVLSKWLATHPKVLILDEPTHGVDVGAKADVLRIVAEHATAGVAVVVISSELEEIKDLSDRVIVMQAGTVSGEFATPVDEDRVVAAAYGLQHETAETPT
jgi:rhamnose transport system ATP-binding protein